MKALGLASIALLAVVSGYFVFSSLNKTKGRSLYDIERFNRWKAQFGKLYQTPSEGDFRMELVINKMGELDNWNSEYENYVKENGLPPLSGPMFSIKPWADLTNEEFKKSFTGLKMDENKKDKVLEEGLGHELSTEAAPMLGQTAYQLRIRDQGECGSCWAFSVIATTEAYYFKMRGVQIDLSQQELVDCADNYYGGGGCDGGWPTDAYWYIYDYGIQSAASYPYRAVQGRCRIDPTKTIWFDQGYTSRELKFTTTAANNAVARGIVAGLAVHSANRFAYLSASPDIYNAAGSGECDRYIDHAVNLGGTGKDANGKMFVTILNSWSEYWGSNGIKKVYPCSSSKMWGSPHIISHTSSVAI